MTDQIPDDIDELIPASHISLSEPPAQKEACIESLLDLLVESGRVEDRQGALDALLAREAETTTGVGMGIGIPHAKTEAVSRPSLAFARSESGVDFGSMDDQPATLIFMILVPKEGGEDHLTILSSLSRALMHDDVRERLHAADDESEVQDTLREAIR
ncbi:fructose PTS transporter subunit IIA [Haloarcula sp. S1CR25-12]|uniref:Fructose PTS transporter subunit IIA n=1 Tax=Haloarcula saliterrae TaxID=2950534 RepID=A0ABU2FHH8_9EURY|nr:fructose PTS transporter subunit IIA [Haloarcula sp. S1CR25-12]MDS0261280.1 fructose PTS transporter subunit IIA [Haloarcula sp. S1CR25-12]